MYDVFATEDPEILDAYPTVHYLPERDPDAEPFLFAMPSRTSELVTVGLFKLVHTLCLLTLSYKRARNFASAIIALNVDPPKANDYEKGELPLRMCIVVFTECRSSPARQGMGGQLEDRSA
jgi:hypothetical protein